MEMKKVTKRLFALGAGALMLGATAMGAMAADLKDYPSFMVKDGTFNGYLVVGEKAAAIDNLAMTDIAAGMKYLKSTDSSSVSVEGDAWLAEESGNFLELGEVVTSVKTYLTEDELGALADGSVSNSKGTANYEQFLYFTGNTATVAFQEDADDNLGFFYKIPNSGVIARYVLDFTDTLKSDVDSNNKLDDIEDKTITVLSKQYTITTATNASTGVSLTLMGGAVSDTINEGEEKTYMVGAKEYKVKLTFVDSTSAKFIVNGQATNKIADAETDVLDDGTTLGISEITYQSYAGGVHAASFFIGADKMELINGSSLKVNEDTQSEAAVLITSSVSSGDIHIDDISVNMTAEDDFYVGEGKTLSDVPELEEKATIFTQNWDMKLAAVETTGADDVSVTFSEGDDQADLKLTLYDGEVTVPLVYHNASTTAFAGESDSERLVLTPATSITDEDLFFVSTADPTSATADAKTFLLQYKGADDTAETSPKARIKNVVTGETYERTVATAGTFDLNLGGVTFTFGNTSAHTSGDFSIKLTGGGNAGSAAYLTDGRKVSLRTKENNLVNIYANNLSLSSASWSVQVLIDDSDKYDDSTDNTVVAMNTTISVSTDELGSSAGTTSGSLVVDPTNDDVQYARSVYGELLKKTANTGSPDKFEVSIPDKQAEVKLYVTSGATTTTTSAQGTWAAVTIVDATKLDSEVADYKAQNLIVVGGPCVNSVAAALLDNPTDCAAGFTAGKSMVKLFENGDKVAMLVAGYSGEDTRAAGKFVASKWKEMTGKEVNIETATNSITTVTAAPVEATPEAE